MQIKKTPPGLGASGRKFWRKILATFVLDEPHELALLEKACLCEDRITEARKEIAKRGPFIEDRWGALKEHPASKVMKDFAGLQLRLCRELGLTLQSESRMPRRYGNAT